MEQSSTRIMRGEQITNAKDAIDYINNPEFGSMSLGLSRMRALMHALGDPQDTYRSVHVAGTNGKGSTCAMIEASLRAQGYRTGLFTSPFIEVFQERIRIGGVMVSDEELIWATKRVAQVADEMEDHPTEFELMAAVGFVCFARAGVDVAVIEVGLGGRLDATNVLARPEVCVIANISFDHMNILGHTITEIAHEKAAIIKPGVQVVSARQLPDATAEIEARAQEVGVSVRYVDEDEIAQISSVDDFSYRTINHVKLSLRAPYQIRNAALAYEALKALEKGGIEMSDSAIETGLEQTEWAGRFEKVHEGPDIIIDGGHNAEGARVLVEALKESYPDKAPIMVLGILEDKDYQAMLDELLVPAGMFICVPVPNPRSMTVENLSRALRWTAQDIIGCAGNCKPVLEARSIDEGIGLALEAAKEDGLIVACGSLYSIAEVKESLRKRGIIE